MIIFTMSYLHSSYYLCCRQYTHGHVRIHRITYIADDIHMTISAFSISHTVQDEVRKGMSIFTMLNILQMMYAQLYPHLPYDLGSRLYVHSYV